MWAVKVLPMIPHSELWYDFIKKCKRLAKGLGNWLKIQMKEVMRCYSI